MSSITHMYKADPNDSTKQIPNSHISASLTNFVTIPVAGIVSDRPTSVILNNGGTYKFCYETTASLGGTTLDASDYVSGSVITADAGPVTLDIQPLAWAPGGANAITGDVTFVYKGVK